MVVGLVDVTVDLVERFLREGPLAHPHDGRAHADDGPAHGLVYLAHLVTQVLDEEGLDDGLHHGVGEVEQPAEYIHHIRNARRVHAYGDEQDHDEEGPRYQVGNK